MRVVVTGTPGTGKTTATDRLEADVEVIHLNDVVEAEGLTAGTDEERGSWIADLDAVSDWLEGRDDAVVESHLAHHVEADRVVVLRCRPDALARRLRDRGEPPGKVAENAEAEALDLILAEAVERHGRERVFEIDTTDLDPAEVAREIDAVLRGDREPSSGTVSFLSYLDDGGEVVDGGGDGDGEGDGNGEGDGDGDHEADRASDGNGEPDHEGDHTGDGRGERRDARDAR